MELGNYPAGAIIDFHFNTHRADGTPATLSGTPEVSVYKTNDTTQSTSGVTLTADFDSTTGLNHVRIDTGADWLFYEAGCDFSVVITSGTVDGISVIGAVVARFTIGRPPVTAGGVVTDELTSTALASILTQVDLALTTYRLDELIATDSNFESGTPPANGSAFHYLMTLSSSGFTYSRVTDSLEALRDRGDAAWTTVSAATIRSAVGLASANLDTQLAALSSQISIVDGIVDAILDDTGTSGVLVASNGLNSVVPADPSVIPALGTANIVQWIGYFGAWTVNRVEVTETEATLRNSANNADLATHALSDDNITFVSDEPT